MNKILSKRRLAFNVTEYKLDAKNIANNAHPGQFIILRVCEDGERAPFTICDFNKEEGSITILVQEVGATTYKLSHLNVGDYICDLVGPLGQPTDLSAFKNIVLVGGGIGTAVVYPQSKYLKSIVKAADVIIGARTKDLIMYEKELLDSARNLYLTTDDGSYVRKGFVTNVLEELIPTKKYDCVFAVGPMPMMRAVCELTKKHGIATVISMNSIMVDGTGMCGCCRVTVGGETKYACVHGPEFDGHLVDFDEAINRLNAYKDIEKEHLCRLKTKDIL